MNDFSCGTYYERTDFASSGTPYAIKAPWAVSLGGYQMVSLRMHKDVNIQRL